MNIEKIIAKFIAHPQYLGKGAGYLAKSFNTTKDIIYEAKIKAKDVLHSDDKAILMKQYKELEDRITVHVDNEKGTLRSDVDTTYDPKNDIDLAKLHKVDLTKYKISNYWSKVIPNGKFTSSLLCTLIKIDSEQGFQMEFKKYLENFKPKAVPVYTPFAYSIKNKVSIILPKQDAHFNKYDIMGNNNINTRFKTVVTATMNILERTMATNTINEVVYIVGSDQFNSEWTEMTTKGTPQQNILSYEGAFGAICNHEIEIITNLLKNSTTVKVVFVPGNHDQFVGWHLVHFLESFFRLETRIKFDTSTLNTKYHKYSDSAIMLNHGDDMKPKDMAQKFPMGFKEEWSSCKNFYIFSGDKHAELSLEISGIKFYRIPQLSTAKSRWDDKKGFEGKPEMTAFIISEKDGMTDMLKEMI